MNIYAVGGCTRDVLLGIPPRDLDYVVVGGSHEEMIALNFTRVGANFPVYLHPDTGDEYALARRETKNGIGYLGFDVDVESVSIEEDLSRRDLTVNSLAVNIENWDKFVETQDETLVIDPFGGIGDLKAGILRHTSNAFAEDPIRVLRTARFSARYGFHVHPSTVELMKKVVPELSTVPNERIWAEFEKGLMEDHPDRMFHTLFECDALSEFGPLGHYHRADVENLKRVTSRHDINVRFALVCAGFSLTSFVDRRIPTDCALVGYTFNSFFKSLHKYIDLDSTYRLRLLEQVKAFNRPWLLEKCLEVLAFYEVYDKPYTVEDIIFNVIKDLKAANTVACGDIASTCSDGKEIKQKIFDARVRAINQEK